MRGTSRLLFAALAALGSVAAACGSDSSPASPTTTGGPATTAAAIDGAVTVFAAASLTAAYTEIGEAFKAAHPGTSVTFSFAASSDLATQINEGAPADVYASADLASMMKLTDAGNNAGDPQVFATNSLEIIVGKGNPKGIASLADLGRDGVIYVTCAPQVPIGTYAAQVLANAKVTVTPASLEDNVKGIVTKVTAGEADAGIVYRTDVIAAGTDADGVEIPTDVNVIADYPVVVAKKAPNPTGAQAFVDFVLGAQGQQVLAKYGFAAP